MMTQQQFWCMRARYDFLCDKAAEKITSDAEKYECDRLYRRLSNALEFQPGLHACFIQPVGATPVRSGRKLSHGFDPYGT